MQFSHSQPSPFIWKRWIRASSPRSGQLFVSGWRAFLWVGGLIYRLPLGSGLTDRALPKPQGVVLRRVRSPHVSKGSSLGFFNSIDEIIRFDRRLFITKLSPYLRAGYGRDPRRVSVFSRLCRECSAATGSGTRACQCCGRPTTVPRRQVPQHFPGGAR